MVIDFSPFYVTLNLFDRLLEMAWNPYDLRQRTISYPPVNISEDEHAVYVRCETAGVNMEDLELTLTDSSLLIKGERKAIKGRYYRQERPTGSFQRVINIQTAIDRDAVNASMRDGLLEVVLPKLSEEPPKKIAVSLSESE